MILFPKAVVVFLILGALVLTSFAVVSLLWMVIKDFISKDIW